MGVVADVVFAVAVVAAAAGAVAELQLRVGLVGTAADGTLVGVVGLLGRLGAELDGFMVDSRLCFRLALDPPGGGQQIQHILSEEEEVVGKGHQREEVVGQEHHRHRNKDRRMPYEQ